MTDSPVDQNAAADTPTPRRKPKPERTEINGRPLKPATLMMGHGFDPVLSEGSLKAPIFLTSTFAFPSAADGKRHFEGITGKRPGGAEGLVYSRFNGPNQEILEDRSLLKSRRYHAYGDGALFNVWLWLARVVAPVAILLVFYFNLT